MPRATLRDDFRREPPYPPDFLFPDSKWSGLGDLDDLRFLERRLRQEDLIPLSLVRLRERLGFALLTMDMQNRWQDEYRAVQTRNQATFERVQDLSRATPTHRALLLGALDALCTLYPDPAVRPTDRVTLLVETDQGLAAWTASARAAGATVETGVDGAVDMRFPGALPIVVHPRVPWLAAPSAELFADAVATARTPAPSFDGLSITQEAPRLTRDATRTAAEAAQGDEAAPPGRSDEPGTLQTAAARLDAPALFLMRREHAVLLAVAEWSLRPPASNDEASGGDRTGARSGLLAWEVSEMTRRFSIDWNRFVADARRFGLGGIAYAVLTELSATWRTRVPAETMAQLRPGPLARWMIRTLPAERAQRLLHHRILRRF